MKYLILILTLLLSTTAHTEEVIGKSISFSVPEGYPVKTLIYSEINAEAYFITIDRDSASDLLLDFPDLSRWEDTSYKSFSSYAYKRYRESRKSSNGMDSEIPQLKEVTYGELSGHEVSRIFTNADGVEFLSLQAYLVVDDQNLMIMFTGPSSSEITVRTLLGSLRNNSANQTGEAIDTRRSASRNDSSL